MSAPHHHPAADRSSATGAPWTVLERGWLSSNNVLLRGEPGEGDTVVDTGHVVHAAQTVALVEHALGGQQLARIVNTHLHSDHCGGNAALQARWDVSVWVPPGDAEAARHWDEDRLTYRPTGQWCARFRVDAELAPGDTLRVGRHGWQVLAAPGHDPHAVLLFEPDTGTLIAGDALWEHGFGVVFPELEGEPGFEAVGDTLELIARLPVRTVIPGHGPTFSDVPAALARARARLASLQADPARHARHAAKVLVKYHLMERRREPLADLQAWLVDTPLLRAVHRTAGATEPLAAWGAAITSELLQQGALRLAEGWIEDV